jgi:hypothetical protein
MALTGATLRRVDYDCLVACVDANVGVIGARCPPLVSALQVSKCKRIIADKCPKCITKGPDGTLIDSNLPCLMPCWHKNAALFESVCTPPS